MKPVRRVRKWSSFGWQLAGAIVLLMACHKANDLSVAQLEAVVERERPTLKACYDAALKAHPHAEEIRIEAVIRIAPSGEVFELELSPGGLPTMPACIESAIRSWRFPQAQDATHTSLPIVFTPEKG